ncbi:MAG: hypothetical protein ACD_5C00032G0001 [uncultured bacterium]|nr:MAG: hypothetical protein ACD_5C00032G0001 [uncultured bacterium]
MKKFLLTGAFMIGAFSLVSVSEAYAYDLYVDKDSSSSTEDGTQGNPYKTISAAVLKAESNLSGQRSIYISNGTYTESFEINEEMSLTGESKNLTIINGHGKSKTVDIEATSTISNLTIMEGYVGIYVNAGAGATIKKCKILKTEKMGVEIESSSTSDSEKVTISGSDISKGEGKGFYIKKRRILIEDNDIEDNEEEGIDIRSGVKGKIKKNTIAKNGESGIELIVGKSDLKITGNKIKSNSASGIANQFYKDSKKLGEVLIEKNKISKNDSYGVRCSAPSGGNVPKNYWIKSIDLVRNIFSGNDNIFAKRCDFSIALKK